MKNVSAILLSIFLFPGYVATAQLNFTETNNGGFLEFADRNGKTLLNSKYDPAIEGSPFLNKDWALADLLLKNGAHANRVSVKLNIESNELYYLDSAGKTWIAVDGFVKKISYLKLLEKEGKPDVFKCGYPAIDKQSANYYYQLLTDGKIELLKKIYKTIETFKNDLSGEIRKEFTDGSSYYVFASGEIKAFKNEKGFVLELMKDKQEVIEKYQLANKINFKKIADIQKLITYYNGLN